MSDDPGEFVALLRQFMDRAAALMDAEYHKRQRKDKLMPNVDVVCEPIGWQPADLADNPNGGRVMVRFRKAGADACYMNLSNQQARDLARALMLTATSGTQNIAPLRETIFDEGSPA